MRIASNTIMTRFETWLASLPNELKQEVCEGQQMIKNYTDIKVKSITFDELKSLDTKFIVSD